MSKDNLEKIVLQSWATLDYRAKEWGAERIVFDAVSNHFPEDSGGTDYYVKFRQENTLVDFKNYDANKTVQEIVMYDHGKGYPYIYTILCYSSKQDKESATGQFGEGLKMISAAAIRNGINLQFGSRDWRANPFAKEITIDDENKKSKIEVLCQEVTVGYEKYPGSFTIIIEPSKEIIDHVLSFRERIIDFRGDIGSRIPLKSVHKIYCPVEDLKGELFIKRIKYEVSKPLLLTYRMLGSAANTLLSPDRNNVIEPRLNTQLGYIIGQINNVEIIKKLLASARVCYEGNLAFSSIVEPAHPKAWVGAFYQLYGDKAVLEEVGKENVNADAENMGYKVVRSLPLGLRSLLIKTGIPSAGQNVSYAPTWELVPLEELDQEQFEIYQLYKKINKLLIPEEKISPEINIFSKAMNGSQEAHLLLGLANWENDVEKIYIRLDQLESPEQFCDTYGHELSHIISRSPDVTWKFENELTKSLGKTLYSLIKETE